MSAENYDFSEQRMKGVMKGLREENEVLKRKVEDLERELEDSDFYLRKVTDNIPGAIYESLYDLNWTMIYMSDQIKELTGYESSDFIQNKVRAFASIIHPEDLNKVTEEISDALLSKEIFVIEYRIITKGGETRWVYNRGQNIIDKKSGEVFQSGVIMDETKYKSMHKKSERSKKLFMAGPVVIFQRKNEWGYPIEHVSQNIDQYGYETEELIGKADFMDMIFERDHGVFREKLEEMTKEGKEVYEQDYQLKKKDGEVIWIVDHTTVIRDSQGEVTHYDGYILNITDRKKMEQELRETVAEKNIILENVPVGVVHLKGGRCVHWNRKFEELFGYEKEEIKGEKIDRLIRMSGLKNEGGNEGGEGVYEELLEGRKDHFEGLMEGRKGGMGVGVGRKRKRKELFWCRIMSKRIDERDAKKGCIWILEDITDRKKKENEIKYKAYHDALTGLPNRELLKKYYDELVRGLEVGRLEVGRLDRGEGWKLAILFIDLDGFKEVNDQFGHSIGDELLKIFALRLRKATREEDVVARLGGDEFVILLKIKRREELDFILNKVMKLAESDFKVGEVRIKMGCSLGVSLYPDDGGDYWELLNRADVSMYEMKVRRKRVKE